MMWKISTSVTPIVNSGMNLKVKLDPGRLLLSIVTRKEKKNKLHLNRKLK